MLPWQQKSALAKQRERKKILEMSYKVAGIHIVFLLLITFMGGYKPVLRLVLGSTEKKMSVDFCQINSFVEKKESTARTIEPLPKTSKPLKAAKEMKASAQPIFLPTTLLPKKVLAPKEEKAAVKIAVKAPEKIVKPEAIIEQRKEIPVSIKEKEKPVEPIKALEQAKEIPAKVETPQLEPTKIEELSLGTISQQEISSEENNQPSASHEIAVIIAQQWYKVKGMPADFFVDISFVINSSGKATSFVIINGSKRLIYQAHAKESLSRCEFPIKYYNKKCRIILKM